MDDPTLTEYRRVSVLSIIAFLLGIASSGALLGGVLFALPVAGLGVGLLALAKIQAADGHFSGRALARGGIFFSVLFGIGALIHPFLFQQIIDRQCRSFAQGWLELLVEGNGEIALNYVDMAAKSGMVPRSAQSKMAASKDIEATIRKAFLEDPLIRQLEATGKSARIRYERTVSKPQSLGRQTGVTQIYSVTGKDAQGENSSARHAPFQVQLHLLKTYTSGGYPAYWTVGNWQLAAG